MRVCFHMGEVRAEAGERWDRLERLSRNYTANKSMVCIKFTVPINFPLLILVGVPFSALF